MQAQIPPIIDTITREYKLNLEALKPGQAIIVEGYAYQTLWTKVKKAKQITGHKYKVQSINHGHIVWIDGDSNV